MADVEQAEERMKVPPREDSDAFEEAHNQRGSSSLYSKEDHLNQELAEQREDDETQEDLSGSKS